MLCTAILFRGPFNIFSSIDKARQYIDMKLTIIVMQRTFTTSSCSCLQEFRQGRGREDSQRDMAE